MRKNQKVQALEYIKLLEEAHNEIKKNLENRQIDIVLSLLAECQEGAIQLGQYIDKLEGEGTRTVALLEKYCEILFGEYEEIQSGLVCNSHKTFKRLDKQRIQVENSIKNDIKERKEIVFLPYKASMWDSLESVYLAAKEDENCDVYVIPIPYYDKNSDGMFKEMYYEGDKFPEYVPITHYDKYHFETHCPDTIFIHNPYDECNYVTSVHPFFYSNNLKRFTNQLVYIPYFVTPDVLPEEFCVMPGCVNADTIIVQSEEVRKNYIYAFKKINENSKHNISFGAVSKKIIALGSPKLEKAYKCAQEEYELPNTWKELIKRPDGTKKLTVFYNTSLSVFLQNDENYLQKLRQVLNLFKNNKEVILWWRPHPLSESTISAMRPNLFREYNEIVCDYKKENWGIYDESSNLYRAIAWCDAYYGDRSSVTMLFTAAQKPVMIQAIKNYALAFENIVKVGNEYWFTPIGYNGLFKLKEGMNNAEFMGCFINEKDKDRLFLDTVYYHNKLFFVPLKADSIAVYSIDTKEFKYIPIELLMREMQGRVEYSDSSKFTFASVNGNNLYLFPGTYPAIIKLNMDSHEIEYLYEPMDKLGKWIIDTKSVYFRTGIVQQNIVKMWCEPAKAIIEFDMQSEDIKICTQLSNIGKYIEMVAGGGYYWLIPREKKAELLKLSDDYRIIDLIKLPEGLAEEAVSYIRGVCLEDYMWIFPAAAEHVLKVSLKNNSIEIENLFDGLEMKSTQVADTDWRFLGAKQIENEVFAFNNYSQELVTYHMKKGEVKKGEISIDINQSIDENLLLDVLKLEYGEDKEELSTYFYEGNRGTLQSYIEILQNSKRKMKSVLQHEWKKSKQYIKGTKNENAGKNIYEYVISR